MCVVSSSLACVTQRDGIPEIPNVWFINFQAFPKFLTSRISHQRSLQIDYVYIVNHFSHCWCVYTHLMTGKKKNTASITLFWQKHQQALFSILFTFCPKQANNVLTRRARKKKTNSYQRFCCRDIHSNVDPNMLGTKRHSSHTKKLMQEKVAFGIFRAMASQPVYALFFFFYLFCFWSSVRFLTLTVFS